MSFHSRKKPNFVGCAFGYASGVNLGGVHQHDWDVVLNGVYTATLAASQAFAVRIQNHWFPANRANQHIEQILGNHRDLIVMLHDAAGEGRSQFL
jgi:alkyl sulfatase BDS1-like metallo-beta-lactamase superfamily hydrolase